MNNLKDSWLIFDDEVHLAKVLAKDILNIANRSILKKNCFSIVLTGGQSVLSLYSALSQSDSNWDKWHIYISDERFLPKGHKDRNDRIINEIWLDNSLIPQENINFIQVEMGLIEAQKEYEDVLRKINEFDVVLLSIGEDGHVASLFPKHSYPDNQSVVIENNSPKSPKQRLSMSYKRLDSAHYIFKLLIGKSKQQAVRMLQQDINLPVFRVRGKCEKLYVCKNTIY